MVGQRLLTRHYCVVRKCSRRAPSSSSSWPMNSQKNKAPEKLRAVVVALQQCHTGWRCSNYLAGRCCSAAPSERCWRRSSALTRRRRDARFFGVIPTQQRGRTIDSYRGVLACCTGAVHSFGAVSATVAQHNGDTSQHKQPGARRHAHRMAAAMRMEQQPAARRCIRVLVQDHACSRSSAAGRVRTAAAGGRVRF
jgi:hypothetical protein